MLAIVLDPTVSEENPKGPPNLPLGIERESQDEVTARFYVFVAMGSLAIFTFSFRRFQKNKSALVEESSSPAGQRANRVFNIGCFGAGIALWASAIYTLSAEPSINEESA